MELRMQSRFGRLLLALPFFVAAMQAIADDPPIPGTAPPDIAPPTASPPSPLPHDDGILAENASLRGVLKAMREADTKALFDLYNSKDPIVHVFAAIAIERTRFNLDAANKDAKVCEDNLFKTKPATALTCAQFQVGDLRLAGKWQAALDAEADLVRRYKGLGRGMDRALAAMQKYLDGEANVPQYSIDPLPTADVVLKFKHDSRYGDAIRPILQAKANGHDLDLLLDTGANNMIVDEDKAHDLGVKLLDAHGHASGWISKGIETQRGLLDTLQIGSIVLRNVPVIVTGRHIALIGGNLLAPLGALRMTEKELTIYAEHGDPPTCDRDMQVGSDLWGSYLRVLPEFLLNDQPHSVMLDTGASRFLIGSKAALDEVKRLGSGHLAMNDIGGSHPFANAEAAKVKMQIDRQPFNIYFVVYTDSTISHDITLGAGALRDMDYILDFRQHKLCFPMHEHMR
jgi:hypothetical protein